VHGDFDETIERLGVLDDEARRAAYRAVRTADEPLSRADVAERTGMNVRLAAFHLDKLVAEGFLESTYERGGRRAGVGHPAKRYRPAGLELEVSIPPRRYNLAAEMLAAAVDVAADETREALGDVAADFGRRLGSRAGDGGGLIATLRSIGYEPVAAGDELVLRNCPFRDVAIARPEVVCAMNLAFVAGVLEGTRSRMHRAVLSPLEGERCCVVLVPRAA
jgi:predicted ArsR family transcriptional regulator